MIQKHTHTHKKCQCTLIKKKYNPWNWKGSINTTMMTKTSKSAIEMCQFNGLP